MKNLGAIKISNNFRIHSPLWGGHLVVLSARDEWVRLELIYFM